MEKPAAYQLIAGGTGGCMGVLCTMPLEVVKTRLQSNSAKSFLTASQSFSSFRFGTGIFLSLKDVVRSDGLRGLWSGMGPSLVGVIPSRALWFTTYGKSKEAFVKAGYSQMDPLVHLLSGIVAGVAVNTVTCPVWVIKTRLQLQSNVSANIEYTSAFDCARKMYKQEGLRSLYKGLAASYLGIAESSVQLVIYEQLKHRLQQHKALERLRLEEKPIPVSGIKLEILEVMAVSGFAKLVAAVLAYPHEVIRTRLREQRGDSGKYRGVIHGLTTILKEEGARGLYGGMGAHLMKVVPNAAIMFFTFEKVLSLLHADQMESSSSSSSSSSS